MKQNTLCINVNVYVYSSAGLHDYILAIGTTLCYGLISSWNSAHFLQIEPNKHYKSDVIVHQVPIAAGWTEAA